MREIRGEAFAASLVVRSQNFYGGTEKNDEKLGIVGDLPDIATAYLQVNCCRYITVSFYQQMHMLH